MTKVKEQELIEKKELREQMINRVEVLEKVKQLISLPGTEFLTQKQVANYYEVSERWIKELNSTNGDEIEADGYRVYKKDEVLSFLKGRIVHLKNLKGKTLVELENDKEFSVPNRGLKLYPKRAVLRIGMLLQKSKIATKIRTELLNALEDEDVTEKINDNIEEEKRLRYEIADAIFDNEDPTTILKKVKQLEDYNKRYINKLNSKIDVLVDGILRWDARDGINRMMRKIAYQVFKGRFGSAYDKLYGELLYKHKIGIRHRKERHSKRRPTMFDVLKEEELPLVVKTCVSLCEMYNIDIDDLMIKEA